MTSSFYIDAHAYHSSPHTQILAGIDTIGVHPWELTLPYDDHSFEEKWSTVRSGVVGKLAIGECGLDRAHEGIVGIGLQKEVLLKHFQLAHEHSLPLIIHSVRANSDLMGMLKKKPVTNNILLHAFGGNDYEAIELLKYPVYFSYGARLLKNPLTIKFVPVDRILLETADQTEVSIEEIYERASKLLNISLGNLQEIIKENFSAFFNQSNDVSASDFIENLNLRHRKS